MFPVVFLTIGFILLLFWWIVGFYFTIIAGKEVNEAYGERRVNQRMPWIALALYIGLEAAGIVLAQVIDHSLLKISSLSTVALLIIFAAYFFELAASVYDLKIRRKVDNDQSPLDMHHQVVLLLFWMPIGIYLVQKDLNKFYAQAAPTITERA